MIGAVSTALRVKGYRVEWQEFRRTIFAQMVALYGRGGVSGLCLALQRDRDADVPVFLICLMADRAGLGKNETDFAEWVASAQEWREAVIRPLRGVRTWLKSQADGDAAFHATLKTVELEAERLHVEALTSRLAGGRGPGDLAARYLGLLGMSDADVAARLAAFRHELSD